MGSSLSLGWNWLWDIDLLEEGFCSEISGNTQAGRWVKASLGRNTVTSHWAFSLFYEATLELRQPFSVIPSDNQRLGLCVSPSVSHWLEAVWGGSVPWVRLFSVVRVAPRGSAGVSCQQQKFLAAGEWKLLLNRELYLYMLTSRVIYDG